MALVRPRYVRHRFFDRLRHSTNFKSWLDKQATRLSVTAEMIFNLLLAGHTYERIEGVTTLPPINYDAPSISGVPTVGQVLTVDDGAWAGAPAPTYTYQWMRDGVAIGGATAETYTLVLADSPFYISCVVTGTNSAGSAPSSSNTVGPVAAA